MARRLSWPVAHLSKLAGCFARSCQAPAGDKYAALKDDHCSRSERCPVDCGRWAYLRNSPVRAPPIVGNPDFVMLPFSGAGVSFWSWGAVALLRLPLLTIV